MKISSEKMPVGFQPVKLEITLETEEEVQVLWHYLNLSPAQTGETARTVKSSVPWPGYGGATEAMFELWKEVDKHVRREG